MKITKIIFSNLSLGEFTHTQKKWENISIVKQLKSWRTKKDHKVFAQSHSFRSTTETKTKCQMWPKIYRKCATNTKPRMLWTLSRTLEMKTESNSHANSLLLLLISLFMGELYAHTAYAYTQKTPQVSICRILCVCFCRKFLADDCELLTSNIMAWSVKSNKNRNEFTIKRNVEK